MKDEIRVTPEGIVHAHYSIDMFGFLTEATSKLHQRYRLHVAETFLEALPPKNTKKNTRKNTRKYRLLAF